MWGPSQKYLRRSYRARGVVQGVGFRPFVFHLAAELRLAGFVRNELGSVRIEVEGPAEALDDFGRRLTAEAPALARIEALHVESATQLGEVGFRIDPSADAGEPEVLFPPDGAPCAECLAELADPADRRHGYAFLNCTHCGPRLTVIEGTPYDRARTTMRGFPMCAACQAEYEDPADRRFHAEPTACPECGPRLQLLGHRPGDPEDPIACAAAALREGRLVAVKGSGGFHLACDARNDSAVAALRSRKHREEKPFAVMVRDVRVAKELCLVPGAAAEALQSAARPIVLLEARAEAAIARGVAPGSRLLGLMLPPTPLHHLLLETVDRPLVMTSGNVSDEPIAYQDADALTRLGPIADLFLTHNRPIQTRCDDSVCRAIGDAIVPFRRSRGYAPEALKLPSPLAQPTLAAGGMLKSTFALGDGSRCIPSQHLGDLDHPEALRSFFAAVSHFESLFRIHPRRLIHDLHPDYPSTAWAMARAREERLELLGVQHHHAHFAAALLDAGAHGPGIGVVFDGAGYGPDGTVWGGEFLVGDAKGVERRGHLRTFPLPGGDRAAREPWRVAVALLALADLPLQLAERRVGAEAVRALDEVRTRSAASPLTSSVGRLFDAFSFLVGHGEPQTFEGQAAMRLEALATSAAECGAYPFALREDGARRVLDPVPAVREAVEDAARGTPTGQMARRFHHGLADGVAATCRQLSSDTGLRDVFLTGGVFQNALLTELTQKELRASGLRVHLHRSVPPNDAGLAAGQLAVAAAMDGGP